MFRFRFVGDLNPCRQQTEIQNCNPWAAHGETGIYKTRELQLGLGSEQSLLYVKPCKIDELLRSKYAQKNLQLSFNEK